MSKERNGAMAWIEDYKVIIAERQRPNEADLQYLVLFAKEIFERMIEVIE